MGMLTSRSDKRDGGSRKSKTKQKPAILWCKSMQLCSSPPSIKKSKLKTDANESAN